MEDAQELDGAGGGRGGRGEVSVLEVARDDPSLHIRVAILWECGPGDDLEGWPGEKAAGERAENQPPTQQPAHLTLLVYELCVLVSSYHGRKAGQGESSEINLSID